MDGFSIIQNFFTKMRCNFCSCLLEPEGVELLRQDKSVYIVNVHCVQCEQQMGVAMVGLETGDPADEIRVYEDPELTEEEMERFEQYGRINYDDVLDAHDFFTNLGSDWQKYLPEETLEWDIEPEPESEAS